MKDFSGEEGIVVKEVVLQLLDKPSRTLRACTRKSEIASRGRSIDKGETKARVLVVR